MKSVRSSGRHRPIWNSVWFHTRNKRGLYVRGRGFKKGTGRKVLGVSWNAEVLSKGGRVPCVLKCLDAGFDTQ